MSDKASTADRRRQIALAGHTGDMDTARSGLNDHDGIIRASALRSLQRGAAITVDDLALGLADPDPVVRVTAAELCGATSEPELLPSLDDPDDRVVEMTTWALGERNPPAPGVLEALGRVAQSHTDPLCREAAIAALGALGDEASREIVLAALTDKPAIRRRAVVALAAFDGDDIDAALEAARHDKDRQVRDAVEELIGPLDDDLSR